MLYYLRVVVGILLIMLFAFCAGGNAWLAVKYAMTRRQQGSMIPLVGGIAGCIGILVLPWGTNWLAVLPLLLDIGSLPNVIGAILLMYRKKHE
jgi:hypothetical protein